MISRARRQSSWEEHARLNEAFRAAWHTGNVTALIALLDGDAEAIRVAFDASGGTYGSPRVTLDLWAAGWQVSENTVAKLMAELGLAGRAPKRRPKHLT